MRVSPRLLEVLLPVQSWVLKGIPWKEVRARTAERSDEDCVLVGDLYREHRFLSDPDEEAVSLLVQQNYSTLRIMDYVETSVRVGCEARRDDRGDGKPMNEMQTLYLVESLALYIEERVRSHRLECLPVSRR